MKWLQPIAPLIALRQCYIVVDKCRPWVGLFTLLLLGIGGAWGLWLAPPDSIQQDAYRIIYVHVPAAMLSLAIYMVMGTTSLIFLVWRIKIMDLIAKVSAPIGGGFTLLALLTGSLWGKPMWGAWWVWDARLTSELILFFLYMGYIGLRRTIVDPRMAAHASAILALIGTIDIPIIHYSVEWWHTLHQGATLSKFAAPSIAPEMLYPLLIMICGYLGFYACYLCTVLRGEILVKEREHRWVKHGLQTGVFY